METLRVPHARFQRRVLAVRPGMLLGPKLLVDGAVVPRKKGAYLVEDDGGVSTRVVLKGGLDPVPKVAIEGEVLHLVRPLAWYEYVWAAWPLALIAVGGALGGLLGGAAGMINIRLMRSEQPPALRYGISAFLGVLAVVMWVGLRSLLIAGVNAAR